MQLNTKKYSGEIWKVAGAGPAKNLGKGKLESAKFVKINEF